jgi:hypothetical protein
MATLMPFYILGRFEIGATTSENVPLWVKVKGLGSTEVAVAPVGYLKDLVATQCFLPALKIHSRANRRRRRVSNSETGPGFVRAVEDNVGTTWKRVSPNIESDLEG